MLTEIKNEWDFEPDNLIWTDRRTGYRCYIWRHPEDYTLRGYVGIPSDHPYVGVDYNEMRLDTHCGPTFAGYRNDVPGMFWIGFDCGNYGDFVPGRKTQLYGHEVYRNISFVTSECQSLARQLFDERLTRRFARKIFKLRMPFSKKFLNIYRDNQGLIISYANKLLAPLSKFYTPIAGEVQRSIPEYFDPPNR